MVAQTDGAFVVIAEFAVLLDKVDRFFDVASQSVAKEPGCEQIDAHLETPLLQAFRDRIDDLVVSRRVRRPSRIQRGGAM